MSTDKQTRVAVVTGAARGIGKSIALRLADDGLDVAINDMPDQKELLESVAEEIQKKGRRAVTLCGDASEEKDVKALVDKAVEELGGVDVMVANAGVGGGETILDSTVENWDRIMRINARGPMLAYKYAAIQMVKQGRGGRIIGISSICGKRGWSHYGLGLVWSSVMLMTHWRFSTHRSILRFQVRCAWSHSVGSP
jgi:NAD(P)-dependent dehydrogenase (short-subunit alcohol dehydrogenase family)